jgi:hypothetical protein
MPIYQIDTFDTLADTVQHLAPMVGFPKPKDPAGSPDPAVQQMVTAVNMAAEDMLNLYDWQNLAKKFEIEIKADFSGQKEKSFALPGDFWCFIDQTQWNKSTQLPAIGPVSPQAWMQLQVRNPKVVMTFLWQIRENKLWIQSPPDSPQIFTFMYMSRGFIRDADDPEIIKNVATKNGDVIMFDPYLIVLLARAKWQQIKGFDSSAAMGDFKVNYEIRKGKAKGAPVLNMARAYGGLPYLNMMVNAPDTGYGNAGY